MPTLTEPAPAKLNLALHVRRRRADGYHELETLFAFTDFGDLLNARDAEGLSLQVLGPMGAALAGDGNLVLRAARALAAHAGITPRAALKLDKRIPVAAGLGGGSADAAAALRLLDRLWRLETPPGALLDIAAALGADVAACLESRTVRGEGKGERLSPVEAVCLVGTPVLLVNPGVAVPTGPVFAAWDGSDRGALANVAERTALAAARNDLAAPAQALAPAITEVLALLAAQPGAWLARMSGSGATCFALFDSAAARDRAALAVASTQSSWWQEATRLR